MTKIQVYQLISVIALIIFVVISYKQGSRNDLIFYPLIAINLIFWLLRQRERRQQKNTMNEM